MVHLPKPQIKGLLTNALDFSHLFDEIPIGISILDLEQRVVYFNRAFEALTGIPLIKAHGMPCRTVLRSKACIASCPIADVHKDARQVSCESDIINMDRQRVPVRISIAPILNSGEQITGFIETLEDLRAVKTLDTKKHTAYSFADIVGRSPQMEKIFQTIPVLAQSDASILITGETGTGKDLVAEAIHQTSNRAAGPFIKINCGALPETLLESEIFGHQKGAFTGAVENKPGRFRLAHNGTIFLTEIGDLPLSLQVKLLTFLDDKVIYSLGSTKGFKANVRMIAATHRNLEQMVREGRFRKDLLFRLNVARIHLPPLKNRTGDIRLLLDHFLNNYAELLNKNITGFSRGALDILTRYNYEGNIRELRNIVEYAVNIAQGSLIESDNMPSYIFEHPLTTEPYQTDVTESTVAAMGYGLENVENPTAGTGGAKTWASAERDMIMDALLKAKGKKNLAAEILGWGRSTLWRKMKQYEMLP